MAMGLYVSEIACPPCFIGVSGDEGDFLYLRNSEQISALLFNPYLLSHVQNVIGYVFPAPIRACPN